MFGTVTRYFNDKGYGFIRGEDQLFLKANMEEEKGKHIQKIHAN